MDRDLDIPAPNPPAALTRPAIVAAPAERRPITRFIKALNLGFTRAYHRLDVVSPCTLPESGPGILICNHTSALDPALIQSACSRVIVWMMAREYYEHPAMRWFFRLLEAIPVDRSGRDLTATRQALRALDHGRILGVFPEGRIETTDELLPFQTGVAMLAMKRRVGIYPAYLDGTQRNQSVSGAWLWPRSGRIIFGSKVELGGFDPGRAGLETATKSLESSVMELRQRLLATVVG